MAIPSINWQSILGQARDFPCISSTYASLNLPKLRGALEDAEPEALANQNEPIQAAVWRAFGPTAIVNTAAMALVSYVALKALSILSLYVNGAIGVGKIALSVITLATDYRTAQNLLEEGVFHILVAVADFAIASLELTRVIISLSYGIAPQKTNEYFEMLYKPWTGAIEHPDDQDIDQVREDRKNYSYLQASADAVQCLILPDEGVDRLQSALAALSRSRD